MFGARTVLEADDYARLDTSGSISRTRADYASRLKGTRRETYDELIERGAETVTTGDILADKASVHYRKYEVMLKNSQRCGSKGSFAVDVNCDPLQRLRGGGWFPRVLRSSAIVSMSQPGGHIFTQRELSSSYGWPTLPISGDRFAACLNFDLDGFNLHTQSQILGEGFHIHMVTAFVWFISHRE